MKKLILFGFICVNIFFNFSIVGAENLQDAFKGVETEPLGSMAKFAGYKIDNSYRPMLTIVSDVIKTLLSLLGVIFLVLLIYGGFLWMTARGNEQQVEKAKEVMYSAIIGLIIVLAAYSVSYFIVNSFTIGVLRDV